MASLISSPTVPTTPRPLLYQHSPSCSLNKTLKFSLPPSIPHLGAAHFPSWSGLKHLGPSIATISLSKGRKGRRKGRMVFASLFGVGAPEALVIGVVALLVFGPKGLAEVARNLGKTLRAFQPTIRELQDVSREFKSTLEREIGLDDIPNNTYTSNRANPGSPVSSVGTPEKPSTEAEPNGDPSQSRAYTADDYLKITEEQLKATAIQQQESTPPTPASAENPVESQTKETASSMPQPQKLDKEVQDL